MKNIILPLISSGKQILDYKGQHVADCVSNEVAATIVEILNKSVEGK